MNSRFFFHFFDANLRIGRQIRLITAWWQVTVVVVVFASFSSCYAQIVPRDGVRTYDEGARFLPRTKSRANAQLSVNSDRSRGLSKQDHSSEISHTVNRPQSVQNSRRLLHDVAEESAHREKKNRDVLPQVVRDSPQSGSFSDAKNLVNSNASSRLNVTNGDYDFLQVVSVDQLASFTPPPDGVTVALPRRNFLIADKELSENERDKEDDAFLSSRSNTPIDALNAKERKSAGDLGQIAAKNSGDSLSNASIKQTEESPDDYVVFTLTDLNEDERLLLRDAQNGRWDSSDLLSASLIAEGLTTQESRAHYRSRFETLLASLKSQTNALSDQLMKTERVYNFLHSVALISTYNLNCSSVAASLDTGVFNCVSATVLFNCFASRVGLEVAALETTGHAKSRVKYEDSYLDIETTCANWDSLPDRIQSYPPAYIERRKLEKERAGSAIDENLSPGWSDRVFGGVDRVENDNFARKAPKTARNRGRSATGRVSFNPVVFDEQRAGTRFSTSNKIGVGEDFPQLNGYTTFTIDAEAPMGRSFTRTRRPMHEITDVELVATIYYNVGVDRYQAGDYEGAIVSYIKAAQLAPNNLTILGNLKATLNNWAIDVATKEKKYSTAIRITELGLKIDPDFHEYNMNMPIFFRDWIEYLAKDNKWDEVQRVQEKYWKIFPKNE